MPESAKSAKSAPVCILDTRVLVQFLGDFPGETGDDDPSIGALPPTEMAKMKSLAPGSCTALVLRGICGEKISLSLPQPFHFSLFVTLPFNFFLIFENKELVLFWH